MKNLLHFFIVFFSLFYLISCESDDGNDSSTPESEIVDETNDDEDETPTEEEGQEEEGEENDDDEDPSNDEGEENNDDDDDINEDENETPDETDENETDDSLIAGTWSITNVEIENSLLTGTIPYEVNGITIDVDTTVSFSAMMTENNDYTSIFTEDPNTLINNGSFDLDITTTIQYSALGTTDEEESTETSTFYGTEETSEWSITGDNINLTLPSSTEVVPGELIQLTENTLIVSTKLIDYIDNFELENEDLLDDFTGDHGDVIFTYTKN